MTRPPRSVVSVLSVLSVALAAGCAYNDSRITVNVPPGATVPALTIVQAGNTASTSKPTDLQANGNDLSYGAAGAALGAGVGTVAGNPAAGALIGAGGGVAVYEIKEALAPAASPQPAPAAPAAVVVPAATGTATKADPASTHSAAATGTTSATTAPAAAGAQGGDATGARGKPPGG